MRDTTERMYEIEETRDLLIKFEDDKSPSHRRPYSYSVKTGNNCYLKIFQQKVKRNPRQDLRDKGIKKGARHKDLVGRPWSNRPRCILPSPVSLQTNHEWDIRSGN